MAFARRHLTKRQILFLVAGSLLVPAVLLSLLGVKLLRDFTRITGDLRAEYGSYLARISTKALEDAFWEQEQLNLVAARVDPPEDPDAVVRYLNQAQQENPLYRFAFFVSPVGLVHYSNLQPERTREFRPLPDWIKTAIDASLLRQRNLPSGLFHITSSDTLAPVQVTYFTVHAVSGELLGAAGFIWNLDRVKGNRAFFDRVLESRLEEASDVFRAALFRAPPTVTLQDETGTPFYSTGDATAKEYIAIQPLSRVLSFYRVGIRLSDDRFDAWVRWVVQTHLATTVVMLLAICLAVIFSLRFILREIELAEIKSSLLSNVSHELKTPLALIRLFAETLEMGRAGSPEKEKEFVRIISKESERLTHLIDNVLDVSRIEQNRKTYHLRQTDLAQVVRETLDAYEYQVRQKGFTLESQVEDGLPLVPADPDAVTQALRNLMDNAIKYSGEGRYLRIDLARQDDQAVISVLDHGLGIPDREQAKIFEKFYRVEKSLVHNVKGSGLGLSLVRHIVDAHGGKVTVVSRPGEGSRFSIHLPLAGPPAGPGDLNEGRTS